MKRSLIVLKISFFIINLLGIPIILVAQSQLESYNQAYSEIARETWNTHHNISVFSVYEPSYYLFGPAKPMVFNASWKYRFTHPEGKISTSNAGFYAGFTLKGLFDRDTDIEISRPIVDLNYMPEFFYWFDFGPNSFFNFKFGYKHNSNGIGGEIVYNSRATNQLYIEPIFYALNRNLEIRSRVFIPWDLSDNIDIIDLIGVFELNINYRYVFGEKSKYGIGIENNLFLRKGLNLDMSKLSLEWNLSVGPFFIGKSFIPLSIVSQIFFGYGETLIFYNQDYLKWRLGLLLTV